MEATSRPTEAGEEPLFQVDTDPKGEVRRSDAGHRRCDLDRLEVHTELTETLRNARLSCLLSGGGHGDRGEDHRIDGEVDDQTVQTNSGASIPIASTRTTSSRILRARVRPRRRRGWPDLSSRAQRPA